MTDNTNNTDNPNPAKDEEQAKPEGSLLDNVKAARKTIGAVAGDFVENFRKDREGGPDTGAHALHTSEEERENIGDQVRAAGAEAREKFQEGSGLGAVTSAAGSLLGHAENIARDVAGSAVRAAKETGKSPEAQQVRDTAGEAFTSARGTVDEAVSSVKERLDNKDDDAASDTESESADEPDIIDGEVVSDDNADVDNDNADGDVDNESTNPTDTKD